MTTHDGAALEAKIAELGAALRAAGAMAATAESCTGGLIGHLLTSVAGSSEWYLGGVVAYADSVKRDLLGVSRQVLDEHGAVSSQCVQAMARGARQRFGAQVAVAVSGIAGPGGGSAQKPVGSVWIAVAGPGGASAGLHRFPGGRGEVKHAAAAAAIEALVSLVRKEGA